MILDATRRKLNEIPKKIKGKFIITAGLPICNADIFDVIIKCWWINCQQALKSTRINS